MFRPGGKEFLSSEIIVDFDDEAVEGMLEFMYFHKVPAAKEPKAYWSVFRITHQFQLPDVCMCQDKGEEIGILDNLKYHFLKFMDFVKSLMTKFEEKVMSLTQVVHKVSQLCVCMGINWQEFVVNAYIY